jgi:putative membrane protein
MTTHPFHLDIIPGPFEFVWGLIAFGLTIGFWVLVVMLIVRLVKSSPGSAPRSSGLRVLEERYARGEITRDEFLERKAVLTGDGAAL